MDQDWLPFTIDENVPLWRESDEEELETFVGSDAEARNYHAASIGREIYGRELHVFAKKDRDHLNSKGIDPKAATKDLFEPPSPWGPSTRNPSGALGDIGFREGGSSSGYDPIPPGDSFRLLEILPGNGQYVSCVFRLARIRDRKGQYIALSLSSEERAWGKSESQSSDLICNGQILPCSCNLFAILSRLRSAGQGHLVWVADLCINQEDVDERNRHVTMSSEIIRNAHMSLFWLGNGLSNTVVPTFAAACGLVNTWRHRSGLQEQIPEAGFNLLNTARPICSKIPSDGREWALVSTLFRLSWFWRAWSLQEVCNASQAVVAWGDYQTSWDVVGLAAAIFLENYERAKAPDTQPRALRRRLPSYDALHAYFLYRMSTCQRLFKPAELGFHQLLEATRTYRCKCPHDRIYALLSLSSSAGLSPHFTPDYRRPIDLLYAEATYRIIQSSKSLAVLSDIQQDHTGRGAMLGLNVERRIVPAKPSWSVLWHHQFSETIGTTIGYHLDVKSLPDQAFRLSSDQGMALIEGMAIDTLTEAHTLSRIDCYWRGQQFPSFEGPPPDVLKSLQSLLADGNIMERDLERLALTLTCGKDWDGFPVTDIKGHVSDFCRCLMRDGFLPALAWCRKVKGQQSSAASTAERDQQAVNLAQLERLSSGGIADRFLDAAATMGRGRAHFSTKSGLIGTGPDAMEIGDMLCILKGANTPFIIRDLWRRYQIVGECYVQELMPGRGDQLPSTSGQEERCFNIQ